MRPWRIIQNVFSVVGLVLAGAALYLAHDTRTFLAHAQQVDGEVVGLIRVPGGNGVSYRPLVQYTDGAGHVRRFSPTTSRNPPGYEEGEQVRVYLGEGVQASTAKLEGFMSLWGAPVILASLGGPFLMIGLGMHLYERVKAHHAAQLQAVGEPVEADVQSVALNEAVSVNGRHPYVLVCQWLNPLTHELHVFESDNIWFDPSNHVPSDKVRVFIDRANPNRYLVDLSFLPKLAA